MTGGLRAGRLALACSAVAVLLVSGACSGPSSTSKATPAQVPPTGTAIAPSAPATSGAGRTGVEKVMIIAEENKTYGEVLGSGDAPYLTGLAKRYGSALAMDAGYPTDCPSLAAYIIVTSGTDHGICDDDDPSAHPLRGDSVFQQVARSRRQWRAYAESMPGTCALTNSADGRYLVRHTPATYYVQNRASCGRWQVPLGRLGSGALSDAVRTGKLPAYSFVSPNACNDMHGAAGCPPAVATGDAWLARWMPMILAGRDFRSGRLAVFVTWDEGSSSSNRIPTLVLSARTHAVASSAHWNHCSTLRTVEDLLGLPLLGCAADARSMASAFSLRRR